MRVSQLRGGLPVPDHRRIHRANDPRLQQPIPALNAALENANVILNKQALTLNRAGSNLGNPMLGGLSMKIEIPIGQGDRLQGVFLFQERGSWGSNLSTQASLIAPGRYSLEIPLVEGVLRIGRPAERNFLRVETARGAFEREFWIRWYDADAVAIEGQPSLDPDTLQPVSLLAEIVDGSRDWIDLSIDFFPSWTDEFHALHNAESEYLDPGFRKAYGGARWVSFFDSTPGTEGVGVQVNPVTEADVYNRHRIQIENVVGTKEITVRFRACKGSLYYVDIPVEIEVVDQSVPICVPPVVEACTEVYLKNNAACPADCPEVPSIPGVQVVAGTPGAPLAQELLVVTVRGAMVGGIPRLRVRQWRYVPSLQDLCGARVEQVGADLDYLPLVGGSGSPAMPPPYKSPQRYTIAFGVLALRANLVSFLTATVLDDVLQSQPILVVAAKAREVCLYPVGETGGGGICGPGY